MNRMDGAQRAIALKILVTVTIVSGCSAPAGDEAGKASAGGPRSKQKERALRMARDTGVRDLPYYQGMVDRVTAALDASLANPAGQTL